MLGTTLRRARLKASALGRGAKSPINSPQFHPPEKTKVVACPAPGRGGPRVSGAAAAPTSLVRASFRPGVAVPVLASKSSVLRDAWGFHQGLTDGQCLLASKNFTFYCPALGLIEAALRYRAVRRTHF